VRVQLLRCRHGRPGGAAWIEIDDAMHTVQEANKGSRLSAIGSPPELPADSQLWDRLQSVHSLHGLKSVLRADSRQPIAEGPHVPHPLLMVAKLADPAPARGTG
jgi:hypothetical protein